MHAPPSSLTRWRATHGAARVAALERALAEGSGCAPAVAPARPQSAPAPAAHDAALCRSHSELCLGNEAAAVGPAAAAAAAAAGVRHWLRPRSRLPPSKQLSSPASFADLAYEGDGAPSTPERAPRAPRGASPELADAFKLADAFTHGAAPLLTAAATATAPSAPPAPERAGFRLLCTLPHGDDEDAAAAQAGHASEDDEDAGPLSGRHVAAVLPRATALSEDVLRQAALASSGAVSDRRARRRAAGVALQLQWLAQPRRVLLVVKPDGGARVDAALQQTLGLLRAAGCQAFVEPALACQLSGGGALPEGVATWVEHPCAADEADVAVDAALAAAAHARAHAGAGHAAHGCVCGAPAPPRRPPAPPPPALAASLDLVLTLGGDGTVLWLSHLLPEAMPPVVPIALGSLCFMTPFHASELPSALGAALAGGFHLTLRHRLVARVRRADGTPAEGPPEGHTVLNDVVIDRGASPYLTNLECFCDGAFVTRVQGDGLIVATPSGSTAYNLAAAGSMVHPGVPGILFTPVCPHSLSFRPLVFPDTVRLRLSVPAGARAPLWASFDGRGRTPLAPGDSVHIALSRWPMPTVCASDATCDWFGSVRETLHWNERTVQGAGSP